MSLTGCLLIGLLVGAQHVSAAPKPTGCASPITQGLWQGVNAAIGTSYNCDGTKVGSASSGSAANTSSATKSSTGEYVALGDSVAAGLGLPVTKGSDPACGVSDKAYPTRVAASTGLPFRNLACSGATAGDLVTEQHLSGTSRDIEPQLDTAFRNGTPKLMTITAGANDLYWQYFAQKCYTSTCGTTADQVIASGLQTALAAKLSYDLASIQSRSNGTPPTVVLTGYYLPLAAACTQQNAAVTAAEVSWLNGQLKILNQTIANSAAAYPFARYAAVDFSGHELCTSNPWIQDINGVAPLHPTAAGQRVISKAILSVL